MDNKTVWRTNMHKSLWLLCVIVLVSLSMAALLMLCPTVLAAEAEDNSIVDASSNAYAVSDTVFGSAPAFGAPHAEHNDASDPVSWRLTYNGAVIIDNAKNAVWANYINKSMPVGSYEVKVVVAATEGHKAVVGTYNFKVTPKALASDSVALKKLNELLRGTPTNRYKTLTFERTGQAQFTNPAVEAALAELQAEADAADTRVGEWANEIYDIYFKVQLVYNMSGMASTDYRSAQEMRQFVGCPSEIGKYEVYYLIGGNYYLTDVDSSSSPEEYEAARRTYKYNIVIRRMVEVPNPVSVIYNGSLQKADIPTSNYYTVQQYEGFTDVGDYTITLVLANSDYLYWEGKNVGEVEQQVQFSIKQAPNKWMTKPDVVRWVEGNYNEEENVFTSAASWGTNTAVYVVRDMANNVIYSSEEKINNLGLLKAGGYILDVTIAETKNYAGVDYSNYIFVLEKEGLAWWATTLIAVGALVVAALVIFILWKKGVFQILTGKLVLAIRTKATVDATIAAVRAAKMKEEAEKSIAAAKAKERAEARAKAAAEAEGRPVEEKATELESRADAVAKRAEKMRAEAQAMRNSNGDQNESAAEDGSNEGTSEE